MSTSSPPRPNYRPNGVLERMPFGKYKGRPFAEVPADYAAWLLKRDIDDRLKNALNGANGTRTAGAGVNGGDQQQIVTEFLEARAETGAAKRRLSEAREALIPLLERNGGACVDEASCQRISIIERPSWEYDPAVLHRLVEEAGLPEERFAECLRTIVDKAAVWAWVEEGLVRREQLDDLEAKLVTKTLHQVWVKPLESASEGSAPARAA